MPTIRPELITRFQRLSPARRQLLLEAAWRLAVVSLELRLLPFRQAIRSGAVPLADAREQRDEASECVWAVETAARRVPWRAVCIHQGLCLQHMLRSRGFDARLHYGARQGVRDMKPLEAHVWVSLDGRILIGAGEADSFGLLATYPGTVG